MSGFVRIRKRSARAIWYYSSDHTAIFELPEKREPILKQARGFLVESWLAL